MPIQRCNLALSSYLFYLGMDLSSLHSVFGHLEWMGEWNMGGWSKHDILTSLS